MAKEIYTKKEVLKLLDEILDDYDIVELYRYWKNPYVGSCRAKIDIKKEGDNYRVIFYCDEC